MAKKKAYIIASAFTEKWEIRKWSDGSVDRVRYNYEEVFGKPRPKTKNTINPKL